MLVVGGGAQGLATAMACRELGLGRVVLIERDRLAAGPSGSAAGSLSPDAHLDREGPAFVEFARDSLRRHEALAAEAGDRLGLRWLDWLVLGEPATGSLLPSLPGVERLNADAVRSLVPGLAGDAPGLLVPRAQARLNPLRLCLALAARGGTIATGIEYLGLTARAGHAAAVRTTHGPFTPGAIVLATGLAPPGVLPMPQVRFKGHQVATEPAPFTLPLAVDGPAGWVAQLEDGRLLAGGDQSPDNGSAAADPALVDRYRTGLAELLPATASLPLSHVWTCARPAVADQLPVIDRAPELDNVWVTAGHYTTGLLLAPQAGHAIATWIASGTPPAGAAPFAIGTRAAPAWRPRR